MKTEAACIRHFKELCAIPHGSYNEKAVVDMLEKFGKDLGLETIRDAGDNLIIKKPATPGYEAAPAVILQGHTDMVCVCEPGLDFDFMTQPLKLKEENGILKAEGTTLGADDGTAVAHMMAILEDDSFVHPAIECVFTSKEEVGLLGALEFDASPLTGTNLIAMDSGFGREDVTSVSCAGGRILRLMKKADWETAEGCQYTLSIGGLLGGHSAMMIDKGRGNAVKLMARILRQIRREVPFRIASIKGGVKMNAIPAEAEAVLAFAADADTARAEAIAKKAAEEIASELSGSDDGFCFGWEKKGACTQMLSEKDTEELIRLIFLLFNGVRAMSMDFAGLTAASSNLGVLRVEEEICLTICIRAAEDSLRDTIGDEMEELSSLFGYRIELEGLFSGWKFDPSSALRERTQKIYQEMTGRTMEMVATHGGMEIGVFKSKMPGLDIVSFAPACSNPHTPDEYLELDSFERVYELICRLLTSLAQEK